MHVERMLVNAGLPRSHSQLYRLAEPRMDAADIMSTIELVDPELRDALALWPQQPLTADTLTQRRADLLTVIGAVPQPDLPDITAGEIRVESAFGSEPIRVLSYRPVKSDTPLPTIVHIHGGGFVAGAPEMKDVENRLLASELRCAIYSVDYRLAPESPHPAPLEDIYSVFAWLHGNAGQLGLDPARIGIKGESGGGGFAAAAALYARDQQGPKFAFQHLIYPMIDDRTAVRKDLHPSRRRICLDAREQLFRLAFAARQGAGLNRCLALRGGFTGSGCVGFASNVHFGGRSRSLPRRKHDLCGSLEPSRSTGRVSHVPAGVSRLLSGNECPRDQAG
jgi:acetyl esterase/lipase